MDGRFWRSVPWLIPGGLIALALAIMLARFPVRSRHTISPTPLTNSATVVPIYAMPTASPADLRHPEAVQKAVDFLINLQPERSYILTWPSRQVVVPMDVAHAAIALVSVGRLDAAEAAMTWLYRHMTRPGGDDAVSERGDDYAGSWYDQLDVRGRPIPGAARGRGEAVGIALIATFAIDHQDPRYLQQPIGDYTVLDLVELAVDYLTSPSMQAEDGRFYHSPSYRVSFTEEGARMALGLKLASQMLERRGRSAAAERARQGAARGLLALAREQSMNRGMAYDYFARAIWGLASPSEARRELAEVRTAGLVTDLGVRNWDWQLDQATSLGDWLHWWVQAQTVAPSQTFDFAIAAIQAGDLQTAIALEKRWLLQQRSDGGFSDAAIAGPLGAVIGFGEPTAYAAARFILFEHLLTLAAGQSGA
ncbi:MAG: hypothetical protein IRY83_09130 [Chloroflexi bacterium]|nr:hypothetical protein [Chloroflexota bacterium]